MEEMPRKIGKYEITGIAGKGAMGVVYVGHDPFIDRRVAIKVRLNQEGLDEDSHEALQARKLFFNEAKAAGALDHPHILRIYEAGESDDAQPYIVMEYVEGAGDLKAYCRPGHLLPMAKLIDYFIQAAEALDYAHQHGITHRDIKPANIMLTAADEIKLCDFGIAQRTRSDQTQILGWFGSPLYMSPEQARDEDLNGQTDLYSLGAVMYEMLTGQQPFQAKSIHSLVYKIINKEPAPIEELRPEVPAALAGIVGKAMQKDLSLRYQTGAELAADLRDLQQGPGSGSAPLSDEEKLALLEPLVFFEGFSSRDLRAVLADGEWLEYADGARLIEEGAEDRGLYVIITGEVSILRSGKLINTLRAGECVGEMAYLGGGRRSATVIARGPVQCLCIDAAIKDWASLPVQMQLNRYFQQVLIRRLAETSRDLARGLVDDAGSAED